MGNYQKNAALAFNESENQSRTFRYFFSEIFILSKISAFYNFFIKCRFHQMFF